MGADPTIANTTGSNNTFIGATAGLASATQRNKAAAIGYNAKVDADNALVLDGTSADAVNVGIGTAAPQSALQVVGNYIQFPTIAGNSPPPADCDDAAEAGRMVVRTDGTTNLYICTGTGGWVGK